MQRKMNKPSLNSNANSNTILNKHHSNPYSIKQPTPPFKGPACRYGMPVKLFADSDGDGVDNVFDCKPYDKNKQDVLAPMGRGMGGANPVQEMISRQEGARQQQVYQKQMEEYQKQLAAQQQQFLNQQAAVQKPRPSSHGQFLPAGVAAISKDMNTGKVTYHYISKGAGSSATNAVSTPSNKFQPYHLEA